MRTRRAEPEADSPNNNAPAEPITGAPGPSEGDLQTLEPPAEQGSAKAPRKRRTRAEIAADAAAAQQAALNAPPDPALVETCGLAVEVVSDIGMSLGFSDPGDKWRLAMSQLSARWIAKFEQSEWFASHPIEAQLIITAGTWIVPNTAMLSYAQFKKWSAKRAERAKKAEPETRESEMPVTTQRPLATANA